MAIAYSAVSSGDSAVNAISLTYSHTTSGVDRFLVVSVNTDNNATCTGVTYAGVSMTQVTSLFDAASGTTRYVFYLVNPTSGANNVVVSMTASTGRIHSIATSYTGVAQTSTFGAFASNVGNTTTSTSTLTVGSGYWVHVSAFRLGLGTLASNKTDRLNLSGTNQNSLSADTNGISATGSQSFTVTAVSNGNNISTIAFSFRQPTSGGAFLLNMI